MMSLSFATFFNCLDNNCMQYTLPKVPRLPDKPVTMALVSGEYRFLENRIQELGIQPITTSADVRLPVPVRFHPDMQVCLLKENLFVLRGSSLKDKLEKWGIEVQETEREPQNFYPGDVLCNAFVLQDFLIGNPVSIDSAILKAAKYLELKVLPVRQGYASCAAAVVNVCSVITADVGIAVLLRKHGFDVLQISPGHIDLPGYDTGMIGGCCGLLSSDLMVFTGKLDSHPDGEKISSFLKDRGIRVLELGQGKLLDVGGLIPL